MSKKFNDWFDYHQSIFSHLSRSRLYFLLIAISLFLPWSLFYQIDERQIILGRLEPKTKAIAVKSQTDGIVAKILVSEGDQVKTDSTLIELDSSRLQSILQQTWKSLEAGEKRLEQIQLSNQKLEIAMLDQQQNKQIQILEQRFKIEELKQELKRLFQDYETQRLVQSSTISINYQNQTVDRTLDIQSQSQLLNIQSDIIETRSRLDRENNNYQLLINSHQLEILNIKNRIQNHTSDILALQIKTKRQNEQIKILDHQLTQYTLKSPTTGTIFNIAISRVGTKINSGIPLVSIVPKNAPLIVRAQLNKPIDSINLEGLLVNLKFAADTQDKNSSVKGKIVKVISHAASEQKNLEIELEDKCIQLNDQCLPPQVGETALVEIITRQRRAIEWLLEPLYTVKSGK
jgi:hemolysin D